MKVIICKYIFRLGDINAFGADPRRVATAGHDVDNAEPIDFGKKYGDQNNAFTARFDSLGSKFNGKTLDDYVNGKSFCCSDNSLDEIEQNETNTAENAKIEDNLYFYHPDHLGSTSMITNYDGEVTQNVAYIPYGEVFVEERNGNWASPFLFNAKELDEETGLYYYGARYLNPTDCRWLAPDPKWDDYKGVSPYAYCLNNPVKLVDPDGRDAQVTGSGTEDDPYVITAVYFYDDKIDKDSQKGLISAISSYNNNGKLWKVGKRNERIFVKFDLSAEKVENADFTLRNDKKIDEFFSFGNIVDNNANEGAFGSSDFRSISINKDKIDSEVENYGYNKSSLIKSMWIHEIGHNLGLEHSDGSEIMSKVNATFSSDQLGNTTTFYSYPSVTAKGVEAIVKKMNSNFSKIENVKESGHFDVTNNLGIIIKTK